MNAKKMKDELLAQINQESSVALEKVDRYVSMAQLMAKLNKIAADEPMIVIKNGSQEYTKSNPALSEISKLNASLIALGKDMDLQAPPKPDTGNNDGKHGGLV